MTKEVESESDQYCDIIVLLFCGTSGLNDSELLGSDESDVVIIAWQLIDININKTGDIHYIYVKPNVEKSESLAESVGISDNILKDAPSFTEAVRQFEQTLRYELNDQKRTCSFTLCTVGQSHVRQVLMPSAVRNNTFLPDFFYSFFDLKKEFKKCILKTSSGDQFFQQLEDKNQLTIENMLQFLDITVKSLGTFGVDHVRKMSSIVQILLSEKYGHVFVVPERIIEHFETKPGCSSSEAVLDETVVRARGLPWQASDHDVARFFKGLNISRGGVALVLNNHGRRNGEALVRFNSEYERELALLRHKHHMGNRYIEVYKATAEEFLKVAAGTSTEAFNFLSKTGDGIIRIRGLPFTATAQDIANFFGEEIPVAHSEEGVLFVKYSDGKFTGDAFVLFENESTAAKALTKHKETIGSRYVEIFKSTAAEVQQVLSRYTISAMAKPGNFNYNISNQVVSANLVQHAQSTSRNCVRLRGMPYSATATDIQHFLGPLQNEIKPNGIHFVINQQGRPSGDAFIQMMSSTAALQAGLDVSKGGCHKKHMGERYVEVFQCSYEEMQMVMMGGTLNRNGIIPPPCLMLASERLPIPNPPISQPAASTQIPFATLPATALQPATSPHQPCYIITQQGAHYFVQSLQPNAQLASTLSAGPSVDLIQQPAALPIQQLVYPHIVGNPPIQTLFPQPINQSEVVKLAYPDYNHISPSMIY